MPPELKDPMVLHHPTRKTWATSAPCGCGMASSWRSRSRRASMPRPRGPACGACARPAAGRIARSSSSPTMPRTTTRACARPGARPRSRTSLWRSSPLQSGAQSDRTRLETGPAALPVQPLLPRPGAGVGGGRAFRPVGARQSGPGKTVCGCLRCASTYDAVYKSRGRPGVGLEWRLRLCT